MSKESESPGKIATHAFMESADGILHALEHLAEHHGSVLGEAVAVGAGEGLAIGEVAIHLYQAVAAAKEGDWTEFGHEASEMSSAATSAATFGIYGAVTGFYDLGIAASHAVGGQGLTFDQRANADLDSLQDDIANWMFNHLHPDAVPDATLSAPTGANETAAHDSFTAYQTLSSETLKDLHLVKDDVIHLPGFVVSPEHHGASHHDGISGPGVHPAHTELTPAHSSSFLNDFGHKELPANMEGVWQAQNLQFWNTAEGATTLQAGHEYAVALDHHHVVEVQIEHLPQTAQMDLSHIYESPFHNTPFVGSDTPTLDAPIFHTDHHHF